MNKFLTKHEYKILFIVTTLFFLSMFFMLCSSRVSAEELPFIVPNESNLNTFFSDSSLESAIYYYENNIINNVTVSSYLVYSDLGFFNGTYNAFCFVPNPTITSLVTPNFDYSSSTINVRANDSQIVRLLVNVSNNSIDGVNYLGYGVNLLGTSNTSSNGSGVYTANYPFYLSGNDVYAGVNNDGFDSVLVFTNTVPYEPIIPTQGHATPPINDTGHYIPNVSPNKPNITPFNPTSPNYPNVDNSNTNSLLESLISTVVYGFSFNGDRLKDSINYITGTQSDLTDYIVDTINRAQNNIVGAIQDFADDFYNNMVSLFEPITQQLAYITQEVDADLITDGIENTSLHSDYTSIVGVKDSFVSVFTDTQEPESFVIPVHLEEISVLNTPTQYIDLSIINPVKGILRTFAWVFTTFALVVTVLDSIPGYVNGGADE